MANKTTATTNSVSAYVSKIADEKKRADTAAVIDIMQKITKLEPVMWGTAIVGFGTYHYVYESGREGDAPIIGLSARSNAIVLYLASEYKDRETLMEKLGKHSTGKACLYIKKLEDVNMKVLEQMIKNSFAAQKNK